MLVEVVVDHEAPRGRHELPLVHAYVLALPEGVDDLRIGAGPPDAVLLQLAHQCRLRVARRGLCEVLIGRNLHRSQRLPLIKGRQRLVRLVLAFLRLHHVQKTGELEHRPGCPQAVAPCRDRDHRLVEDRGRHLAGHQSPPDQVVQLVLVIIEEPPHALGGADDVRRADGLMRLLGALGLLPRDPGAHELLPVFRLDELHRLLPGLLGDASGVGSHVGDEADGTLGRIDALVELLGHGHRLARREVQPIGRGPLEGAGDERRLWVAASLLALHIGHGVGERPELLRDGEGLVGRRELQVLAVSGLQLGIEHGLTVERRQRRRDTPVLVRHKGRDLALAHADEAKRCRLHATGAQCTAVPAARDLLPQEGAEQVPHEPVEHPPGLLGVHEVHVDMPGMGERLPHRGLGDLVELDALGVLEAQRLHQVPRDGLSLAVRV